MTIVLTFEYYITLNDMSRVVRKSAFYICENKGADQLCSDCTADQRLCFRYMDSTIPLLSKSKISSVYIFCGCTARFVSDLVGYPEDRFSQNEAHMNGGRVCYPNNLLKPHTSRSNSVVPSCGSLVLMLVSVQVTVYVCIDFIRLSQERPTFWKGQPTRSSYVLFVCIFIILVFPPQRGYNMGIAPISYWLI